MFDVRKMERPHRSGVIAIIVVYALFYIAVDFTSIGSKGEGTWKDLVLCHLVPVVCIDLSAKHELPPPPHEYRATALVYCPQCKVREKKEECDPQIHRYTDTGRTYEFIYCPTFAAWQKYLNTHSVDDKTWVEIGDAWTIGMWNNLKEPQ